MVDGAQMHIEILGAFKIRTRCLSWCDAVSKM